MPLLLSLQRSRDFSISIAARREILKLISCLRRVRIHLSMNRLLNDQIRVVPDRCASGEAWADHARAEGRVLDRFWVICDESAKDSEQAGGVN